LFSFNGSRYDLLMNIRRRVIDDQLYFITFSVYRRRKLLDHEQPKRILLGWFHEVLDQYQASCVGFVVMPDHVHALVWFARTGQLSSFMHSWKRRSSIALREWYRQMSPGYFAEFGEGDRFWQPRYYSFEIYETAKLEEKLRYMHENPVRAGLVPRATDWKWSSSRWYEWQRSVGVPIHWIE
jgi:putative transposase